MNSTTIRALIVGLILGALSLMELQYRTENALDACKIDRAVLQDRMDAF